MKKLILLSILLIVGCEEPLEPQDCAGVAGGTAELDNCGVCDTDLSNDCVPDCAGVWGGNMVFDGCNICGGSTEIEDCVVTDIDGNVYQNVKIGNQLWMAENLKVIHYNNGDDIPNITNSNDWFNLSTGAYVNYDNNLENSNIYGRLYNWYTVEDSRGICPVGWHTPSDDEWTILTNYLGGMEVAGGKMKETGHEHWEYYSDEISEAATNESGFTGLPGGYRHNYEYEGLGTSGVFWSSTGYDIDEAGHFSLNYNNSLIYAGNGVARTSGMSVRCVAD